MQRGLWCARMALFLFLLTTGTITGQVRVQAADPAYEIINLDPSSSGDSHGFDVNNAGQAVGWGGASNSPRGFSWVNQVFTPLLPLRKDSACGAVAANAQGVVVGQSLGARDRAVKWKKGKPKLLSKLAGFLNSRAQGVNDRGQIVGYASKKSGGLWPVLWSGGHAKKLRTLPGATWSEASAINNQGQIVGYSEVGGIAHAVRWEGKRLTDLGLLPGYPESSATALNEVGQIVGCVQDGLRGKAVLWQDGVLAALPDLGGTFTCARSINEMGWIVGVSNFRAVLWRDGQVIDLNTLIPAGSGWVLEDARAINDQGWIVGTGSTAAGTRAFLLRPLP